MDVIHVIVETVVTDVTDVTDEMAVIVDAVVRVEMDCDR